MLPSGVCSRAALSSRMSRTARNCDDPRRAEPIGVAAEVIRRTLDGRLKISPDGAVRTDERYLLIGRAGVTP